MNKQNINADVVDFFDDEDVKFVEHFSRLLLFHLDNNQSETSRQAFALQLAHELEAPAFAIRSSAHRLMKNWQDPEKMPDQMRLQYLRDIFGQSDLQLNLAKSISYGLKSELSARRDRYKTRQSNVQEIIEGARNIVIPICRSEGIYFANIKIFGKYPSLYIYINAFLQVFFNLFTNSIKYRHRENIDNFVVQVSCEPVEALLLPTQLKRVSFAKRLEDDKLAIDGFLVKVSDWGIGVSKDYAEEIFQVGVREPGRERYTVRGAGIGLSLVRRILFDFGGAVWLSSNKDPTTISIFLPNWLRYNRYLHLDEWKNAQSEDEIEKDHSVGR